jgi:biotin carboxylase
MSIPADKPMLLLIGSSSRISREFILQSVSRRYDLWLLQPDKLTWENDYVVGNTLVDNTDPAALLGAARQVAARRQVDGVFCYDEGLIAPAAHVSQALGLPGCAPEAIATCRDKHATRVALDRAGVPQPLSQGVSTFAEATAAADKIGYPVVVKPRGLAGSMGVRQADDPSQLREAYEAASAASYPGVPVFEVPVLIEEFADGPEISIDAVSFEGHCTPLVVARKRIGMAPFFEEIGHDVDADDELLHDDTVVGLLRRSLDALGFHTGVSHTEFRLTRNGPRLVEVNARLGGDMIPYLGLLTRGVDVAMAAADVAAGRRPETVASLHRAAAVRFLYPDTDAQVEAVTVHEERCTPEIHSATAMARPGATLRLPPRGYISRYGRVIAVAHTLAAAQAAVERAGSIIELTARSLPEAVR